jgi:hypothetical protein
MTGSGKQPSERLLIALYRTMLWLVAVIALGEAPSSSEQAGRSSHRYVAESSFSAGQPDPFGKVAYQACVSAPDDPDGPAPGNDLAEASDQFGLPPTYYSSRICPRLALGMPPVSATSERSETAGTQARAPPAVIFA